MSKLDELIQEYCPDGVEYKKLGEICNISRGVVISKDYVREHQGEYPVYSSQTENDGCLGKIDTYNFDGEYITWTTDGANAGTVFYRNGKFNITNVCGLLDIIDKSINIKFLYYILSVEAGKYVNRGMGNPKLMSNVMANIKVPIPPLPVQKEIVRILDNFTEYTEKLKAELDVEITARKKQYEYYRDKLLTFNVLPGGTNVRWMPLGESCYMKAGKAISSSLIFEHNSDYLIKCYGGNGIRGYVQEANETGPCSIIGRQGALCGNIKFVTGDFYATEHAVVVKSKGEYDEKFLYYILNYMNLNQYKSAGAQPGLSVKRISELLAPIPPLEIQKRIVHVLDNFERICSDLNIGLPAEIEARQKQYEYYRDTLLTFAAKGDTILTDRQTDRTPV